MRQFFIIYFFLVALVLTVFGFRGCKSTKPPLEVFPDMDRQARFHEQGRTELFGDKRMDRQPVPGTVPVVTPEQEPFPHLAPDNRFRENDYLATGMLENGAFGRGFPVEVSFENMKEGQEIFGIYCAICHGDSGNGKGVVADERYGYNTIISLLQSRIAEMPEGEIFNTITRGKNTMGPYGSKISVEDRWKVIMYVRALQRAAAASVEDVPAENRGELGL
ncbi:MAG: c-type cytochrome [Opitutales bacterium]|jgi:mono/diheme cytochrome c family protein